MLAALHQQQQAVLVEQRAAAAAAAAAAEGRRMAALTALLSPPAASPSPTATNYYMPLLPGLQPPTAAYPAGATPAAHPLHMLASPPLSRQAHHAQQAQQAQQAALLAAQTAAELERHSSQALSGYSELQHSGGFPPRGAQLPPLGASADLLPGEEPVRYSPAPACSIEAAEAAGGRGTPGHRQALSEAAAAVAGAASQSAFALAAARGVAPGLRRARVGCRRRVCLAD